MSCSVIITPIPLGFPLPFLQAMASTAMVTSLLIAGCKNTQTCCEKVVDTSNEEVFYFQEENISEQSIKTPFVDKNILLKTIKEQGGEIIEAYDTNILVQLPDFSITYERQNIDEPFVMTMKSKKENLKIDKVFIETNNQYSLNVQEQSYLNLINNLKENNMEIETEEILEDNTVVLTINID